MGSEETDRVFRTIYTLSTSYEWLCRECTFKYSEKSMKLLPQVIPAMIIRMHTHSNKVQPQHHSTKDPVLYVLHYQALIPDSYSFERISIVPSAAYLPTL